MEYKQLFSKDEIDAVVEWFNNHKDQMPESLQVDKATYLPDFPRTVNNYIDIAHVHYQNPTYSGQIFFLFKLQEAMKKECGIADWCIRPKPTELRRTFFS